MKVTDLKRNEGIACTSKKEAYDICRLMHDAGLRWCTGSSYIDGTYWDEFTKDIVYYPANGYKSSVKYAKKENYKTYPASKFLKHIKNKTMKKQVKLLEENLIKAYNEGCSDVKKVLKNLHPDVEFGGYIDLSGCHREIIVFHV